MGLVERGSATICRGISTFVIAVCVLAAGCSEEPQSWPSQDFDTAIWAKTPEKDRYVFVNDVVDRGLLQGKNISEVEAMLGTPSVRSESEHSLTYVVKTGGNGFNQVYVLDIRFDPSTNTMQKALVRGD